MANFRLILFVSILFASCAYSQYTLPYTYNVSEIYFLSWGFSEDNTAITMQVMLYQESWVGICFHNGTDSGMTNGDYVVGWFDNGTPIIEDRCSETTGEPDLDIDVERQDGNGNCTSDLLSASVSQIDFNGSILTLLTFQRLLNTTDPCDCVIVNDTMNFAFAYGSGTGSAANEFGYHQNNKGTFSLNLFNFNSSTYVPPPSSSYNFSLQGLHGTLMVIAFGFLMTLGTFLPRYLKEFWWWFPLHIIIQVTAVVLSLIAFGIALYMVDGDQFSTVHSYFGIVTLILAFVSPFIGTASHFMWKPSRTRIPIFPDVTHWWVARIALVLSYCTIFLGMYVLGVPVEFAIGFLVVLITYAFVFGFLDVVKIKEIGVSRYFSLHTDSHTPIGSDSGFKDY